MHRYGARPEPDGQALCCLQVTAGDDTAAKALRQRFAHSAANGAIPAQNQYSFVFVGFIHLESENLL